MSNSVDVAGMQLDILSGNGVFDGGDECICVPTSDGFPTGCDECYYDYGIDKVSNKKAMLQHLEVVNDSGICSDTFGCEEEGVCNAVGIDQIQLKIVKISWRIM